jgi:tetratricopeptide (TPR) repeat protein
MDGPSSFRCRTVAFVAVAATILPLVACGKSNEHAIQAAQTDTLLRAAKYTEAVDQAERVLARDDRNIDANRAAGVGSVELGRLASGYQHLLRAQVLAPDRADIRADLARVYLISGRLADARDHALSILDRDPRSISGLVLFGAAAATPQEVDDAVRRLEANQEHFGSDPSPRLALASLYQRKADVAKAAQAVKDAVATNEQSPEAHAELAAFYENQGNSALAQDQLKAVASLAPTASAAAIRVATSNLLYGRRDRAVAILRTIANQTTPIGISALKLMGELALADSNTALAEDAAGRILRADSSDTDGLLQIGRARLLEEKPDDAKKYCRMVARAHADLAPAHFCVGTAMLRANEIDSARAELTTALKLTRNYPEALERFAILNVRAETPRATITDADRAVKLNPRSLQARRILGEALINAQRVGEANEVFRDAVKAAPERPEPHYWLGLSLSAQGKRAEARQELESALRMSPGLGEAMSELIRLDLLDNHSDSALARVNAQLALAPQSAALYSVLGTVHIARNERDAAVAALEKSVALDPTLVNPHVQLTNLYVALQRFDRAIEQGEVSRKLDSKNTSALIALGVAYQAKRDYQRAREVYERALAADPNSVPAANNLAVLLSDSKPDQQDALRYAYAAIRAAPNDPHIKDTAGWILYKLGRYSDALPMLQQSAERLPNSPEVQYHYGMVTQKTGDTASARRALNLAVAAKIDFPGKEDARKALSLLK